MRCLATPPRRGGALAEAIDVHGCRLENAPAHKKGGQLRVLNGKAGRLAGWRAADDLRSMLVRAGTALPGRTRTGADHIRVTGASDSAFLGQ